ncbi:MAG: CoA transferase [Pseudomonadota bacterium]
MERTEPAEQTGPLKGLRVVEFGHFIAAPFATRVLGDLGAEVLKIEPPGGDPVRAWGDQLDGQSLWWSVHARNKKSITLNLKDPSARQIALDLVAQSDAVIENFRPGLMERFGLGPDDLAAVNPGCVLVRVSGFGQTGPRAKDASFGMIGEAIGGIRHLTGYPSSESELPPVRTGVSLGDTVAGLYGAVGLLAAVLERREARPAEGTPARIVDIALTESVLSLLEGVLPEYGATGKVRQPTGSRILTAAPSNAYLCSDGAWIVIGANSPPLFARLMACIGKPELVADARFSDNDGRVANVVALDAEITAWTEARASSEILSDLAEAGIPSAKIYTAEDIVADPQYRAREAIMPVADPLHGREILHPAPVPRFPGENPDAVAWPGPAIGAHTEVVLKGVLGMSDADYRRLKENGTI